MRLDISLVSMGGHDDMASMAMYTCTSIGRAGAWNIYSSTAYHMLLVNEEAVLLLQWRPLPRAG